MKRRGRVIRWRESQKESVQDEVQIIEQVCDSNICRSTVCVCVYERVGGFGCRCVCVCVREGFIVSVCPHSVKMKLKNSEQK